MILHTIATNSFKFITNFANRSHKCVKNFKRVFLGCIFGNMGQSFF